MHLEEELPSSGVIPSKMIMRKIEETEKLSPDFIKGAVQLAANLYRPPTGS